MDRLECVFCRRKCPYDLFRPFCPQCGEPMLLTYPLRRRSFDLERALALEKYLAFLPLAKVDRSLSLGEGNTPLVPLERVRSRHRLPPLYAKNEAVNPTQSFKDRGTAVAVQRAVALGVRTIGTVSTGNMASSTAAYGARAGLRTVIFLKQDSAPEKTLSTGIHGASVFKVKGDYGALFKESYRIGREHGILFLNSVDPLRIEGYKITGFEIYQQLGCRAPRFVFVPVSSAGHLIGLMRSFHDLRRERLVDKCPIFVGVQARGCSPLVDAFDRGKERFSRIRHPETLAHGISNPDPPGGNLALKLIRENQGILMAVTDLEILAAQKELAEFEGIFADPASATVLAGLVKLSRSRRLNSESAIVLVITGSGLKAMDSLVRQDIRIQRVSLGGMEKALAD